MTTQSAIAFSVGSGPRGTVSPVIDFNQSLQMVNCSVCSGSEWCLHRADVLAHGEEISPLHDWFQLMEEADVLVPVFPSKGVYLAANLSHAGYAIAMSDSNMDLFYGVIGTEEGLNAMRNLYFDHVMTLIETNAVPACKGSHGVQAQRAEENARGESGNKLLMYVVTIALKGMCEVCSRRENYDDLVPDVSTRTGRPNPFTEPRRR